MSAGCRVPGAECANRSRIHPRRPGSRHPALGTVLILTLIAGVVVAQEPRIASDFEIASAQKELARQRDPLLKMAAHLNLGDLYATRREPSVALTHYRNARQLASAERLRARRNSDLSMYATATAYLGFAEAKLNRPGAAFDALEEAMRYSSDSAKLWNLYATAMNLLDHPRKGVGAARRAVLIATDSAGPNPGPSVLLDLAVYRYTLSSSLLSVGDAAAQNEAGEILRQTVHLLTGAPFEEIRRDIARDEKFEIYSTTRTDADAYLSLMNRSRLRLARLYEDRGAVSDAIDQLEAVLELRSDEPTALRAMARLTGDRDRFFAEAFDANPFSTELIREYETHVESTRPAEPTGETISRRIQRAVHAIALDRRTEATVHLEWLNARYPRNEAIAFLAARSEARNRAKTVPSFLKTDSILPVQASRDELHALVDVIRSNGLTPEQRARLDRVIVSTVVVFDEPASTTAETTTFTGGTVEDIRFRFQQPVEFRGQFEGGRPIRLEFRVLGANQSALILEPVRIAT